MPIYAKQGRIIHHIHIPGCAGNSISELLRENNWTKLDIPVPPKFKHFFKAGYKKNNDSLENDNFYSDYKHRDIWKEFFDGTKIKPEYQFAVVRNPYTRIEFNLKQLSSYPDELEFLNNFESNIEYKVPAHFLMMHFAKFCQHNSMYDNKFMLQSQFLDSGVRVYKIESGLEVLLDDLVKLDVIETKQLNKRNASPINLNMKIPWNLPGYEMVHEVFSRLYKKDFKDLNYPIMEIVGISNRE